ncbi:hypothetical protein N5J43_08545 [Pseudomonas nicosulfuronedens]|uniref:hypothetical protein n=1 Tax=Pseudomonas nicosulfuronedens TaxID=2571105 RepID=UPI002446FF03|nr:hypothetical protein [Pseudomonas nicosulfuronedens]MDH1010698.1 hypothetical protein [Pseudomonas nicosulfuronedens]MDH1978996.1 hypothetical protein [Pseudomonas nicosulfuronedens]MDH2025897.1 hypothetical protein [Pseudomonas nicosulfuronedens]
MDNESNFLSHQRSSWHLRALRMQWFGVVLLFLAAALAALTDFLDQGGGVSILIVFAVVGLLALLVARLILLSPAGRLRTRHP